MTKEIKIYANGDTVRAVIGVIEHATHTAEESMAQCGSQWSEQVIKQAQGTIQDLRQFADRLAAAYDHPSQPNKFDRED